MVGVIESKRIVKREELPFSCPPPGRESWNKHPRVFLQLSEEKPEATCPYCGARYKLESESAPIQLSSPFSRE